MSVLSEEVFLLIKQVFPRYKVFKEHFVLYKNRRLLFDFYLPELLIVIEAQGRQHDEFVEHFHKDAYGFADHKKRDRLKKEWAIETGITLVEFREEDMPMTKEEFIRRVYND